MKNVFRWTCGNVSKLGLEVLHESVIKTQQVLGDNFNYFICYHNIDPIEFKNLSNITLVEQRWQDLPIPINLDHHLEQSFRNSIWKFCPVRLDYGVKEIICDNDLIILNSFKELKTFLITDSILLLDDPLRFYGAYDRFIPQGMQINGGFIGLPPKYNFGEEIKKTWEKYDRLPIRGLDDEQGLTALTLISSSFQKVLINKKIIVELHPNGYWSNFGENKKYHITGKEGGIHFTEINRSYLYPPWQIDYKNFVNKKIMF